MGTSLGKAVYQKKSFYFERTYFPEIKMAYFFLTEIKEKKNEKK